MAFSIPIACVSNLLWGTKLSTIRNSAVDMVLVDIVQSGSPLMNVLSIAKEAAGWSIGTCTRHTQMVKTVQL